MLIWQGHLLTWHLRWVFLQSLKLFSGCSRRHHFRPRDVLGNVRVNIIVFAGRVTSPELR
jgi:hypothetical protein